MKNDSSYVYWFPRAAVTDYHKLVLGLETMEISSLVALEARSPESGYLQGCCPSEASRENPSLPLVAFGGGLTQSLPLSLHSLSPVSVFVSPCLSLMSTFVM